MGPGALGDQTDFGFGNFVRVHPCHAYTLLVDRQHDVDGIRL
jgi:hypothetical protein